MGKGSTAPRIVWNLIAIFLISMTHVSRGDPYYKYLGCYSDSSDLKAKQMTVATLTLDQCAAMCQQSGYPYTGIQSINMCNCGMVYDLNGKSSTSCNYTSCGANTPRCGGYLTNDVYYSVDSSPSLTKNHVTHPGAWSFSSARMTCVTNGGDLACPTDATIQASIIAAVSNYTSITKVWIGLYRKQENNITANFYWTDETTGAFAPNKSRYASFWADGDSQSLACVSLDVKSGKWSSTDCAISLPFVCKQPPAAPVDGSSGSSDGDESSTDAVGSSSKRLALFIVLPLFLLCYGGSCILYCIHKIIKNCRHKKPQKMNLAQPEEGLQKGARDKTTVPPYRPLSAGKRVAVFPAPQPLPIYIPDSEIKQKLNGDPAAKGLDGDPLATARGVKVAVDGEDGSPPPKYSDRQEEKRARLLENASRESRMRREKTMEEGLTPSRPFTAQKQDPGGPSSPREDPLAESQGSTTKLLGKDKDEPKGAEGGEEVSNTPISEILKMKMAQKADKKRPRKIIAA